ncbi:MAG: D-alanine--D-alanine ligase family protein [Nocardioidaceae bacterium]
MSRVVVLAGGLSHERDVSLQSGRRVTEALRGVGAEVTMLDADESLAESLREEPPDCVVPLLHGETGEGGALQELLEFSGVTYVGSGPGAARLAFDKPTAKHVVAASGVRTPTSVALAADTFRQAGAGTVIAVVLEQLGLPLMVKPARGGSALGCSIVTAAEELPGAMVSCFAYGEVALIEQFVSGLELSVPVFAADDGPSAYPAVEIRPDGGVYDYTARYTAGATEFVVPAQIDDTAAAACADAAVAAHRALGLRDLSRCDLIIDDEGVVWFLEVNVAPGMTETSLVPLSVEAAGRDVGTVFAGLVDRAVGRDRAWTG